MAGINRVYGDGGTTFGNTRQACFHQSGANAQDAGGKSMVALSKWIKPNLALVHGVPTTIKIQFQLCKNGSIIPAHSSEVFCAGFVSILHAPVRVLPGESYA